MLRDNAVSAIADQIWQYRTGRNLPIFDKDHDTTEGRSRTALSPLARFLQPSIRNQARLDARAEFVILQHSLKGVEVVSLPQPLAF